MSDLEKIEPLPIVARVVHSSMSDKIMIIAYKEDGKTISKIVNYSNTFSVVPSNEECTRFTFSIPCPFTGTDEIEFEEPVVDLLDKIANRVSFTWWADEED